MKRGCRFYHAVESIRKIMRENNLSFNELKSALNNEIVVPVSIFKSGFSPLGALVVYLKDKKGMNFSEIAKALNRSSKTIWATYKKNKKRSTLREEYSLTVPLSIFSDREHSIMENLTIELKDKKGMRFVEIARCLNRSPKTVWCFYHEE